MNMNVKKKVTYTMDFLSINLDQYVFGTKEFELISCNDGFNYDLKIQNDSYRIILFGEDHERAVINISKSELIQLINTLKTEIDKNWSPNNYTTRDWKDD